MLEEFNSIFARIEAQFQLNKFPKLKLLFKNAINNITNLTNLLLRKSLLKDNFYGYTNEYEYTFFLPEEKELIDKEKPRVMFERLKAFMNALDFQSNNLPSFMDSLSDEYIKNCQKCLSYFEFHNFKSTSTSINTKILRTMIDRILTEKDQILKRVILDNLKLLEDNFIKIKYIIDDFIKFKKERYFSIIRFKVFPFLKEEFNEKLLHDNPSDFLNRLFRYMKQNTPDIVFNKEFIFEAIKSCYEISEKEALEKLKKELLNEVKVDKAKISILSPREKLFNIINYISNANLNLEKIYIMINQNLNFLHDRKKNIIEKILEMFKNSISSSHENNYFKIDYIDPSTKKIQNDTINISDFLINMKKKIVLFNEMLKPDSQIYKKIKASNEDSIYKFLEKTYFDLMLTKERIIGLDGEIRLKISKKNRSNLKEISEPVVKLNEILLKTGEMRRKYVMEEEVKIGKDIKAENRRK